MSPPEIPGPAAPLEVSVTPIIATLSTYFKARDVLAAEFTSSGRGHPATLTINRIADGRRVFVSRQSVSGKREARAIAKTLGATPWNF